jgi:hypothetical protein
MMTRRTTAKPASWTIQCPICYIYLVNHLVADNALFVPALARAFAFTTHLEESCSLRRGSLVYDIGALERCPVGHKSETRGDNT